MSYIQPGTYLDFPDLVLRLLENKERVSASPSEDFWLDIGRPEDYDIPSRNSKSGVENSMPIECKVALSDLDWGQEETSAVTCLGNDERTIGIGEHGSFLIFSPTYFPRFLPIKNRNIQKCEVCLPQQSNTLSAEDWPATLGNWAGRKAPRWAIFC